MKPMKASSSYRRRRRDPWGGSCTENYLRMRSFYPRQMSVLDLFRNEYVTGVVTDKSRLVAYRLDSRKAGND
jgi:hypothetical protein